MKPLNIFVGILFFVICLLATLPASHILHRIPVANNMQMAGVSGTIWSGKIQQINVNGVQLSPLRWSLSGLGLITGKASLDVDVGQVRELDEIFVRGQIAVGLFNQTFFAENLTVRMPAQQALNQANLPMQVLAKGAVEVKLSDAKVQLNGQQALCEAIEGTGQWRNAQVLTPSGLVDLGVFDAALGCTEQNLTIQVTEPNAFNLTFNATGRDLQSLKVSGRFKIPNEMPNEIKAVGRFLGQVGTDGYTQFTW